MRERTYSPIFWAILATTSSLGLAAASHAQAQSAASGTTATPSSTSVSPPVRELDDVVIVGTVDDLQSLDFYAPNSSIVISEKEIEAQGARKIDQVLHYQAGILTEPFGADNKVEWFKIRGFDASMSLDGTPTTPNGFFVWKPEIFGVESIEVLKGPSSLVFGASQTGGVVNLVTKRPHKEEALLLNAEVGNRDRLGISADYNGIANEEGNVYYRIVSQVRREDGTQHRTDMHSYYLAPSVTVDFSPRTSLTLLTSVQHEEGTPTNGFLPAYGTIIGTPDGSISRRLNAGEPDFDHLRRTQISAGWTFTHEFADDWTFTQNYKFSRLNINQQNVYAYNYDKDAPRELMRGYSLTHGSTKNNYIDNRVSGKLNLGQYVELLPTVGFDYLKSDTSGNNNGFGWVPNLDMFNPVYGKPFDVSATPYDLNSKQLGVYGSLQMRVVEKWLFNAGIRHDKAKSDGFISGSDSSYDVNHNSVNAGVMYISDYGIAPYFNYSESFRPIEGVDGAGNAYKPYEGQQAEFGLKLEPSWLDGTVTLAYFDAKEKNALISNSSNIQSQSGKRTNKGVEVQGDINLTSNTALTATYTHNHSRQDVSDGRTIRTALIPKHQASLWLSHELALPNSQRLTAAAGVRYNGSSVDEGNHPGETVPSFTLLDLMARYEFNPEWSLQLNARNLTDKTYVSGCEYYCYYGNGRTVDLQLQYQWR